MGGGGGGPNKSGEVGFFFFLNQAGRDVYSGPKSHRKVLIKFVFGSSFQNHSEISVKESNWQSSSNERLFRYISRIFISVLKHAT